MSAGAAEVRQKLRVAGDLQGVVRAMKAMAASEIGRYERAVHALHEYDRTVNLGLAVAMRELDWRPDAATRVPTEIGAPTIIVFGSDQGLVGQFNDVVANFALSNLAKLPAPVAVWAVGERVRERLVDSGLAVTGLLGVPNDVSGIATLVGYLLIRTEHPGIRDAGGPLYVFHNHPLDPVGYEPRVQRLLPLDCVWRDGLLAYAWPGKLLPEVMGDPGVLLQGLVREYLFISLFKACAESLTSENASRLEAMQRADKNIDDITHELTRRSNLVRQMGIDEELFDVISGFEALNREQYPASE